MAARVADAARAIARGGLVVYPTDTLWGLGARATSVTAVRRLAQLKGRSGGAPVSVAVSSLAELESWAELGPSGTAWVRRHLPGPFTVLARPSANARRAFPAAVLPPSGRLGLRLPDHPIARALAASAGPIVSTSANHHGEPPARSLAAARAVFGDGVAVYLPGSPAPSGHPSTLVDLSADAPRLVPRG